MMYHLFLCSSSISTSTSVRMIPPPPAVLLFIIVPVILSFFPCGTPALMNVMTGEDHDHEQPSAVELLVGRDDFVNWAGYGEDKLSTVTISGRVMCGGPCYASAAPEDKTAQLSSTIPVSGATVAIFCGIKESRKSWVRATTDEYGDYFIELPSHLHAIPDLEKVCFTNLLHLPKDSLCNRHQITRTEMIKGIKLQYIEDGARAYIADTIHLQPRSSTKVCESVGAV